MSITPPIIPPIAAFPTPTGPFPNTTPFTYRSAITNLKYVDDVRAYAVYLAGYIDEWFPQLGSEYQTTVNQIIAQTNGAVADLTADMNARDAVITAELAENLASINLLASDLTAAVNAAVQSVITSSITVVDPVLNGIALDPASLFNGTLTAIINAKTAPALATIEGITDDVSVVRATKQISAACVYEGDFVSSSYVAAGIGLTKLQAFVGENLTRDSFGAVTLAKNALTNIMPNLPLAGAALGVIPAGAITGTGALPTGWENAGSAVQKEVIAFDASSVTLKITASGGSFGGIRFPAMSPTGPVVFSFDLESGTLPALSDVPAYATASWFKSSVTTELNNRLWWTGDSARRVSVQLAQPAAASQLALAFVPGSGAPASQVMIVKISNPRVDLVADVGINPITQPPYAPTTSIASTATLKVDNGAYVVMVRTTKGQYLRKRVTASGGTGIDLAAVFGYCKITKVWVIPNASWTPTLSKALPKMTGYDWRSPVVRLVGNMSSAPMVMGVLGRIQNSPNDFTGASADSAALRSINFSETLPGRYKVNIRPGDQATNGDSTSQERAEFHVPDKMPFDTDVWLSHYFTPDNYPVDGAADPSTSFNQLRYTNDPGDTTGLSPEFTTRGYTKAQSGDAPIPAGMMRLFITTNHSTGAPPAAVNNLVVRGKHDITKGEEHHLLVRLVVSRGGGGHLQYWLDGVEKFNADIPLGHNRIEGPQWRFGGYSNTHATATRDISGGEIEYGITSLFNRLGDLASL